MRVFELQGVNFENKGAEMMLHAAAGHFAKAGKLKLALPFRIGSSEQRQAAGLDHLMFLHSEPRFANLALSLGISAAKNVVLRNSNMHTSWQMSGLIDASGFLYSDQWGLKSLQLQARKVRRFKKAGKPVVFLPQAFGPFESPEAKSCVRQIVEHSDLIFARDRVSYNHLVGASGQVRNVFLAPDFTNLLEPTIKERIHAETVFIVPNARMIDKSEKDVADQYINCLSKAVSSIRTAGLEPVIMVHDAIGDRSIATEIKKRTGEPLQEMTHADPLVLKGWLAQARGVIGSRYHALVSALSSGTPVISLGWSHKYGELMGDYGLDALNLSPNDTDEIDRLILSWKNDRIIEELKGNLALKSNSIKREVNLMWEKVDATLLPYL